MAYIPVRFDGACKTRRLVLLDVENVVGGALQRAEELDRALLALSDIVGDLRGAETHLVIGCGTQSLRAIAGAPKVGRVVFGAGLDGADRALLDVMITEKVAQRYAEIVLVSGDGIFAGALAQLSGSTTRTVVVADARRLSRKLRMAAGSWWPLASGPMGLAA
ncbi:hypothetical protein [Agrococcus sp. SCSIO52902]|uniref:hypothetical protein n=1 Tax=Agrococcus sp. SCSIO52902 TaxID=2933290 RepID=UPI001FF1DF52|nr:hypothetical protein [Agrococcus sp. SCSIO52902]UOW01849.1 hypothetical protein MU522_05475 [Agrococcus sp. SCSIO52902]